jgi:hypothetical protein
MSFTAHSPAKATSCYASPCLFAYLFEGSCILVLNMGDGTN